MFKLTKKESGFTLIELMIVIAIIGILAAIAIPQFAAYRVRSFNASAQSDIRNLSTSEAAFFADWQVFGFSDAAAVPGAGGFNAAVLCTGPSNGTNACITGDDSSATARGLDIGLGNWVSLAANTDAVGASFTGASKHLQGNTCYGVDSDTTSTYQNNALRAVGDVLVLGDETAPVAQQDDFAAAGGDWVVK